MKYLLDTTVVSALRVRGREPQVQAWATPIPVADLFVTALTIAEIERGVVAEERTDPAQGAILRQWLEYHVLPAFAGRVLPFDLPAARILATYPVPDQAPLDDALIAAIAQSNGMTIATRNTRHFEPLGLSIVNPWNHRVVTLKADRHNAANRATYGRSGCSCAIVKRAATACPALHNDDLG